MVFDRLLQDLRYNKRVIGFLTVLVAGDFRQMFPVIPKRRKADYVNMSIKS